MVLEPTSRIVAAAPVTVVPAGRKIHLIAGEDLRFSLSGEGIDRWLPQTMRELEEALTVDELLERVPPEFRANATSVLTRLCDEGLLRIQPELPPKALDRAVSVRGDADFLPELPVDWRKASDGLTVFCQDTLGRETALRAALECRAAGRPFLWVSSGAHARAFVSPVFSTLGRPCLACLFAVSDSLGPVPELHSALREHDARGGALAKAAMSPAQRAFLSSLVVWKVSTWQDGNILASSKLHVVEWVDGSVESYSVRREPACAGCGDE